MAKETTKQSKWNSKSEKKHDLHDLGEEISKLAHKAKAKYDAADPKTKKGIIAGLAGAATLLAGAIGYKKIKDRKK